jgi:hypothetical protein
MIIEGKCDLHKSGLRSLEQCFPFFFHTGTFKLFFISRGTPAYENENKRKRQFAAQRGNSSVAKSQTKFSAIFWGIFGIVCGTSPFLFMYSTIYSGTWLGNTVL